MLHYANQTRREEEKSKYKTKGTHLKNEQLSFLLPYSSLLTTVFFKAPRPQESHLLSHSRSDYSRGKIIKNSEGPNIYMYTHTHTHTRVCVYECVSATQALLHSYI